MPRSVCDKDTVFNMIKAEELHITSHSCETPFARFFREYPDAVCTIEAIVFAAGLEIETKSIPFDAVASDSPTYYQIRVFRSTKHILKYL